MFLFFFGKIVLDVSYLQHLHVFQSNFYCSLNPISLFCLIIIYNRFCKILIALTGKSGIVHAVKLYPAGATTNSQDGVTDLFGKCLPVLDEMVEQNMPLLVISVSKIIFLFVSCPYLSLVFMEFFFTSSFLLLRV